MVFGPFQGVFDGFSVGVRVCVVVGGLVCTNHVEKVHCTCECGEKILEQAEHLRLRDSKRATSRRLRPPPSLSFWPRD